MGDLIDRDAFNKRTFLLSLGIRIAKLRTSQGYSQDRLALEAGFARGTMSKIENGLVDPKATTLARIADTLGILLKRITEV